jgi:hypothetical protein
MIAFDYRSFLPTTVDRVDLSVGMTGIMHLLELGEELGCGALGRAVGEVED